MNKVCIELSKTRLWNMRLDLPAKPWLVCYLKIVNKFTHFVG
jgi:hypothetical protein